MTKTWLSTWGLWMTPHSLVHPQFQVLRHCLHSPLNHCCKLNHCKLHCVWVQRGCLIIGVILIEGLQFSEGEEVDIIPHLLLRKYIAWAKQYIIPKISSEAAAVGNWSESLIIWTRRHLLDHCKDYCAVTTTLFPLISRQYMSHMSVAVVIAFTENLFRGLSNWRGMGSVSFSMAGLIMFTLICDNCT